MSSVLTTSNGNPVDDNQHSQTAGARGPIVLQDFHLIDKLAHFDRERIPERVVHAKGAAAHGYFEVTNDVSRWTKAKFLAKVGKRTPVFQRFSTVGGERGSADTARDPRGFAIKFYTEEGNWDMVGNNTPVFFIRDPLKFPDFIHTQKRNPQTNLKDPDMFWDFLSLVPESLHQVTILFSDRGTPDGYRHMNGYSGHTFKLVNAKNEVRYCKWHFKTDQRNKTLTADHANELSGSDPDYATRDLFDSIARRQFPSWSVYLQIMSPAQADKYKWDILDVTKVWPHRDFPLIPVGRLVLDRNPTNYFAETEQSAFSPGHLVPGIEASFDKMLQGRLFSYPDTHRHRLGPNYTQIPINCPRVRISNQQRDGPMCVSDNQGAEPNYEPNSVAGTPRQVGPAIGVTFTPQEISGTIIRRPMSAGNIDFEQPAALYKLQSSSAQDHLIDNVVGHLGNAKRHIQRRQLEHFRRADRQWAARIEAGLVKAAGSRM